MAISIIETAILRENPLPAAPRIRKIHKQKAIIARKRNEKNGERGEPQSGAIGSRLTPSQVDSEELKGRKNERNN